MLRILMLSALTLLAVTVAQTHPAFALDPLDRINIENPGLVNALDEPVGTKISVNQQVQVKSDVRNNQNEKQQFIYIVQVKDAFEKIVSLGWISGDLDDGQVFSPTRSWTPQYVGEYRIELYVWDSFEKQSPLTEQLVFKITVS